LEIECYKKLQYTASLTNIAGARISKLQETKIFRKYDCFARQTRKKTYSYKKYPILAHANFKIALKNLLKIRLSDLK
jgi:hypothetical protein